MRASNPARKYLVVLSSRLSKIRQNKSKKYDFQLLPIREDKAFSRKNSTNLTFVSNHLNGLDTMKRFVMNYLSAWPNYVINQNEVNISWSEGYKMNRAKCNCSIRWAS